MVLDGMAKAIDKAMGIRTHLYRQGCQKGYHRRVNNPYKVHLLRFADDWVATATDKQIFEQLVILNSSEF